MRRIVYYVATSLDGFIAGPGENISDFVQQGAGVTQYLEDLKGFDTVIMGRKTYEFGYQYGLIPGQPAYPHMDHYVFSNSLSFESPHEKVHVKKIDRDFILELKQQEGTDIYLCGGGQFAGWLLNEGLIDQLKIKLNPMVLGKGISLFNEVKRTYQLTLKDSKKFPSGMQIISYDILY